MTPPRSLPIATGVFDGRVSDHGLDGDYAQAVAGVSGIEQRIAGMDQPSTPAAFMGSLVFQPESASFELDTAQAAGATRLVNYVVRSGMDYQVRATVGGDGVFLCHAVRLSIWQRLYVNGTIKQPALMPVIPMVNQFRVIDWTTKFSLYPIQPKSDTFSNQVPDQSPCLNYRWNVQDPLSGKLYSDKPLSATALMHRNFMRVSTTNGPQTVLVDGALHKFYSPWRFSRAQPIIFLFRPITDIVQFDSSISGTTGGAGLPGLSFDDRENSVRNQAVTVQAEFIGERIGGSR